MSDELERLKRWDAVVGVDDAVARAVAEERAAVVAWLRNGAGQTDVTRHDSYGHAFAHEIERGEHRREEEK